MDVLIASVFISLVNVMAPSDDLDDAMSQAFQLKEGQITDARMMLLGIEVGVGDPFEFGILCCLLNVVSGLNDFTRERIPSAGPINGISDKEIARFILMR